MDGILLIDSNSSPLVEERTEGRNRTVRWRRRYDGIKSRESVWHIVSICDSFSNNVPTGTNGKDFNNTVVSCGVCDNIMIINWER